MKVRVGNKIVGDFLNGVLTKKGKQVVLFRLYDGFGIPEELILRGIKINEIAIHYEGKVYTASRQAWAENALPHQQPGYEMQLVLPRRFFRVEDPKQPSLFLDGIYKEKTSA